MSVQHRRGGEPDGARLLDLARRELLEVLLPQLEGDARYRARLIANALKIAGHELRDGPTAREETASDLQSFAETALPAAEGVGDRDLARILAAALRAGRLDGHQDLYDLLCRLTERRRASLG